MKKFLILASILLLSSEDSYALFNSTSKSSVKVVNKSVIINDQKTDKGGLTINTIHFDNKNNAILSKYVIQRFYSSYFGFVRDNYYPPDYVRNGEAYMVKYEKSRRNIITKFTFSNVVDYQYNIDNKIEICIGEYKLSDKKRVKYIWAGDYKSIITNYNMTDKKFFNELFYYLATYSYKSDEE